MRIERKSNQRAIESQDQVWQNRLLNTLASKDRFFGDDGQPPPNLDWPVPKAYPKTWRKPLVEGIPDTSVPFSSSNWPVPGNKEAGISLKTWADPLKINLLGKDKFFGAAGEPPSNIEWAIPRRVPAQLRHWDNNLLQTTLGSTIPVTIFRTPQIVKIQSRADAFPTALRTWINKSVKFIPFEQQPFSTDDWPNPVRIKNLAVALRSWNNKPLQFVPTTISTIFRSPLIQKFYSKSSGGALNSEAQVWQNLLFSTLGAPNVKPFLLADWPVPKGKAHAIALKTWTESLKTNLFGQDQFFGIPGQPPIYDWQNPRGAQYPISLRTWQRNLLERITSTDFPFAQLNWPVPRGKIPVQILRTWIDSLRLEVPGLSLDSFPWEIDCILTCRGSGTSGTIIGQAFFNYLNLGSPSQLSIAMQNSGPVPIDFTQPQTFDLSAKWGSAVGPEEIGLTNFILDIS